MSDIWQGPLEKIDDYRWRIPKTYKAGMRVDGIIYADEKLLKDIRQDKAAEQVANVAFLPGIVNASLAMPDIHWGYGFCLTKDTKILTNLGFYKSIVDFEKDWPNQELKNIDFRSQKITQTPILKFIKLKPKEVFRIVTKVGYEIKATGDHPLFTPLGMRPIEELSLGDKIAIFPFEGIPYEEPSSEIIISEEDVKRTLIKLGRKPGTPKFEIILQKLKNRALLPVTLNHPKLPYILKIMGFVFGDASMNFIGKKGDGVLHFAGKPEDLEEVRKDLIKIGYTPTPLHFQRRKDPVNTNKYYDCCSFLVNASSLVVLLETLGVPRGTKVNQAYRIPKWIFKTALWQKRLFLASLFGCELRIPHRRLERRGYFNVPVFPMAKREDLIKNGENFLKDIAKLLKEFDVRTLYIDKRKRHISKKGEVSWALELLISPKPENLFNLWGKIGFEYNYERSFIANVAVYYLKLKLKFLNEKEEAIKVIIPQLLKERLSYQKIASQLAGNPLTKRFIIDVCWKLNKGKKIIPRIPANFPAFEEYLETVTEGLGQSGMVWDEVDRIEKSSYQDFVYDFTVSHDDHNFIADNFVVSNCIGGVAATDIEQDGVISPAGVGYDINCLDGDTYICNELGYRIKIKDYEKNLNKNKLICMDFSKEKASFTKIIRFLKQKPHAPMFNIVTETDRQIVATGDHPFYTKDGMKHTGKLEIGEKVAIYPFEGVDYEEPSSDVIVDKEDIRTIILRLGKSLGGRAIEQIINYLQVNNMLPLRYNSVQLPYLLKIMGYCFGDGLIYLGGKRKKGTICFYGKKEDLKNIKEDLARMGFRSRIYSRLRHHKIKTMYGISEFDYRETWLKSSSNALAILLVALGTPLGNKCYQPYELPAWLLRACLWQKRLFLAGLFGAELSAPATLPGHGYNFYCPTLSMNKIGSSLDNGYRFLKAISKLLSEFGVSVHAISQRKEFVNKKGIISYRLRLIISNKTEDLINLYSKIGFEYNEERKFLANCAVGYLKLKRQIIRERQEVATLAPKLYNSGSWDREQLYDYLTSYPYISQRFVERSLYENRKTGPRMWGDDLTFEQYIKEATKGLGHSGMVWESIKSIVPIQFDGYVYDFTVAHPHHNFIANNFVVSNCGVRMLKTNFQYDEIKNKIKDLVYVLFSDIPSGVGSKGDIKVSEREEREILVKGAKWAVEKGYGTEDDLECTEEYGAIQGADPLAISKRAYERGKAQSGTLGSGNHFLEIQVIDQLYERDICDAWGLTLGQITVMIHSGSRGLGYQICDDYTRSMIHCLQKYNINVPDRQLACAPVNSPEGKAYLGAMKCAANYAWANRQCLMYLTRKVFEKVFGMSWQKMGMYLIYDVAHNIAKIEKYTVNGKEKTLCVHRKGATRAFGPGHPALPDRYKKTGQPVIIPGDMGRNSYLLLGTQKAMEETFGSTCFTGDTKILSDKGIVTLREIYEFNKLGLTYRVLSFNKDTLSVEWKPILGVSKRINLAIRISVSQTNRSRFSTLDVSTDHKFSLFENAQLQYEDIEKIIDEQKMICVLDRIEIPWTLHYPRLAFLMGALVTDGYIDRKQERIIFTQKEIKQKLDFINYVRNSFETIFEHDLSNGKVKVGGGFIRGKTMVGVASDFVTGRKQTIEEIVNIYDNLYTWILGLSPESTFNFLAGVIDGDGTWNPTHKVIDIFNSKENVIGAIVLACLKLGILPYVSIQRNNCYIIQISERLEEILKFTKRVKGMPHKQKYGSKLFSVRQLFTENWKSGNIKWPFKRKANKNNLMEADKILKFLAWRSSSRYNRKKIVDVINSPLRMHRVKKVMDLGVNELYNIDVQDNHNYFVFTKTFVPVLVKNCHGAGRVKSRTAATKSINVDALLKELESKGITVKAAGRGTIVEEAPQAYKDVNEVVDVVHNAGISKRVCRMRPLGVIKG